MTHAPTAAVGALRRAGAALAALAIASALPAPGARAADAGGSAGRVDAEAAFDPDPLAGWPVLELRGGSQAVAGSGNAMICAEIGPWRYLAVEGCGSGAGFLYEAGQPNEMVHFRLEGSVPLWADRRLELLLQPGFGFAEIERGGDAPGFRFGPARSEDQREGAGPEASLGMKLRVWPHERFHATAELNAGAAWIRSAPVVLDRGSPWVPFAIGSMGLGF